MDSPRKKWQQFPCQHIWEKLTQAGWSQVMARLLVNRGIADPITAQSFLHGGIEDLTDPHRINGVTQAVQRIIRAIKQQERILVYGDYDVDGITSTALIMSVLKEAQARAAYYIPNREEGYGVNREALEKAVANGFTLVITVDCGISSLAELQFAVDYGLDVIVTDHHEPPVELPAAVALINPKLAGQEVYREMAGVGVAWKLAIALSGELKLNTQENFPGERWLDLVTLGTIADIVPLLGENRLIVKFGLPRLAQSSRPGIRALMEAAGVKPSTVSSDQVAFFLAPRLNACGRMDNPRWGAELLLADNYKRAREIASFLNRLNTERQKLESAVLTEAEQALQSQTCWPRDRVLVLVGEDWHQGVLGIVAARIAQKYYRPTLLITIQDEVAKGSGRSIPGFNLYEALLANQGLLQKFGGHHQAVGLTIEARLIPDLRQAINTYASGVLSSENLVPSLWFDAEVSLSEINESLYKELELLAPFGHHNPGPVLVSRRTEVIDCRLVGNTRKHLKMKVGSRDRAFDAIGFRLAGLAEVAAGAEAVDLAFGLEINEWNGRRQLQLQLKDIKSHCEPDNPFG